jgi:hypothetical protein
MAMLAIDLMTAKLVLDDDVAIDVASNSFRRSKPRGGMQSVPGGEGCGWCR